MKVMAADMKHHIEKILQTMLDPGQVVELRALEVSSDSNRRPHTEYGYFDEFEMMAVEAARLSEKTKGLYFTLNPINPNLLARSANRTQWANGKSLTSDIDILHRRWLLIDVDPVRPSGISATEEEHEAALNSASEIREYLRNKGWPDPVLADSGNGSHLLYRIDMPADDGGLIKGCLEALSFRFDDDRIKVDQGVHNPARLCRVYGTLNRKGDNVPDRPHRLSKLLDIPETLVVVSQDLLEKLAGLLPKSNTTSQNHPSFNLDGWIQEHNLDVVGPLPWKDGRKWIFRKCPWNPDHINRSAFILQFFSGAIVAGCHHNGCKGQNWHSLRDLVDSGWRDQKLSSRSRDSFQVEVTTDDQTADSAELLTAEYAEYCPFPLEAMPEVLRPLVEKGQQSIQCPPEFIGIPLLVGMGAAIGQTRKLLVKEGWLESTAMWAVIVGEPGTAKTPAFDLATKPLQAIQSDWFRQYEIHAAEYEQKMQQHEIDSRSRIQDDKPISQTLRRIWVGDTTVEALAPIMQQNPRGLLLMWDELGGWINGMDQYKGGRGADVQFYLGTWSGKALCVDRKHLKSPINLPTTYLAVVGGVQPGVLARLLNSERQEDGFASRFLISYPLPVHRSWTDDGVEEDVCDVVRHIYEKLLELDFISVESLPAQVVQVGWTPEGYETFKEWASDHFEEMDRPELEGPLRAAWGKMDIYAARISLILQFIRYAAGETRQVNIEPVSVISAASLVGYFKAHALRFYDQLYEQQAQKLHRRILTWAQRHQKFQIHVRDLISARIVQDARQGQEALESMESAGLGSWENPQESHRVLILYPTQQVSKSANSATPSLITLEKR